MQIFISWSGERSNRVAYFLRTWLQNVLQGVEVWLSDDIRVGERWFDAIINNLSITDFFIACVTPENVTSPWMVFEAGAMATRRRAGATCAYLIDMQPHDLSRHPLVNYHHASANKQGTWNLVRSINDSRGGDAIDPQVLKRSFEKWWPELQALLTTLPIEDLRSMLDVNFAIFNKEQNLCLEVAGDQVHNGASIQVGADRTAPGQRWRFREAERGFFRITAYHSEKCMDVMERRRADGSEVHQWEYKGGDNQQWAISKEGDYHRFAARHSGLFLDCTDELIAVQSLKKEKDSQLWKLLPAGRGSMSKSGI